jgi:tetratricopeptide (TPR) repeat protein
VLRHLPEANVQSSKTTEESQATNKLIEKGLPAIGFPKFKVFIVFYLKKVWNFALEAKDLKPHANVGYKMKKIFGGQKPQTKPEIIKPQTVTEVRSEEYYLENIKLEPKNLNNYDALGKFYLEKESLQDARDIYQYLVNHEPSNPEYHARLAYCFFKEKNFQKASEHYEKSTGLDSTQPNRYYNLGLSLEMAGNYQESVNAFEQAINLEPTEKYYKSLSEAYKRVGNDHKAREAQFQAKKIKDREFEEKKS